MRPLAAVLCSEKRASLSEVSSSASAHESEVKGPDVILVDDNLSFESQRVTQPAMMLLAQCVTPNGP